MDARRQDEPIQCAYDDRDVRSTNHEGGEIIKKLHGCRKARDGVQCLVERLCVGALMTKKEKHRRSRQFRWDGSRQKRKVRTEINQGFVSGEGCRGMRDMRRKRTRSSLAKTSSETSLIAK